MSRHDAPESRLNTLCPECGATGGHWVDCAASPKSETPEVDTLPVEWVVRRNGVPTEYISKNAARSLERRLSLAQAEIKGHMRTEDDLKADYVRAREFIEQQSTRIAELEGALGNAVEALHNDFEPDNQSRAYHAARNALKARA